MRAKLQANPPTELIKRLVYYIIKSEGGGKNYLENIPERLAHTILDLLLLREMRVLPKKFPNELFQILFNHDDYKENLVEDTLQNVAELLSRSDSELLHEILTPRREHLDTLRALFGTKADKLKAQQLTAKYGTI
jgi:hypothetical protein